MIWSLLRWWYGPGLILALHRIGTWTAGIERTFSIGLLLRTLFAPWRRIVNLSGRSLDDKVRAMLDNLVSRCVGFAIRSFVLLTAGIASIVAFLAGVCMVAIWPFLPPAIIYFAVRSVVG